MTLKLDKGNIKEKRNINSLRLLLNTGKKIRLINKILAKQIQNLLRILCELVKIISGILQWFTDQNFIYTIHHNCGLKKNKY